MYPSLTIHHSSRTHINKSRRIDQAVSKNRLLYEGGACVLKDYSKNRLSHRIYFG